jgi:NAD(P)-dependent dehydrogenase (short-subunit alcohol dehydrogenase family)
MRAQRAGTIVVLSSIAAVRPRKANFVYGAAKAGLDAFARGLTDALEGTGVRVVLVRPGFVIGRMTAGMSAAPLSSTPEQVGAAVADAVAGSRAQVWVPRSLGPFAMLLRLLPRPLWRKMRR